LEVNNLRAQLAALQANRNANTHRLKISTPEAYDGSKGTLRGYLTKLRAYFKYNNEEFYEEELKVLFAASLLKGNALTWFEPTLRDFVDNPLEDDREDETNRAFSSFMAFEDNLKKTFGEPDETRAAQRELQQLKQRTSVSAYATEFRRISSKLGWDDDVLIAIFYPGLKDEVKDDLVMLDQPDTFPEYVEQAVKIDNRLYERRMEKGQRGTTTKVLFSRPQHYKANTSKKFNRGSTAWGSTTHAGPMELDATQRKDVRDIKQVQCYNCQKTGHYARDCRQPKKFRNVPEGRQHNVATRTPEHRQVNAIGRSGYNDVNDHDLLSWTACYDDSCRVHMGGKNDGGWYPKEPEARQAAPMTRSHLAKEEAAPDYVDAPETQGDSEDEGWTEVEEPGRTTRDNASPGTTVEFLRTEGITKEIQELAKDISKADSKGRSPQEFEEIMMKIIQKNVQQMIEAIKAHPTLSKTTRQLAAALRRTVTFVDATISPPPEYQEEEPTEYDTSDSGSSDDDFGSEDDDSYAHAEREYYDLEPQIVRNVEQGLLDGTYRVGPCQAKVRRCPGTLRDRIIVIKGLTLQAAFGNGKEGNARPGDAAELHHEHQEHFKISWASCLSDKCVTHLADKIRHDLFPRRARADVPHPYLAYELQYWIVIGRTRDGTLALLARDPAHPKECERSSGWNPREAHQCAHPACAIHQRTKIYEWHKYLQKKMQGEDTPRLAKKVSGQSKN
jgi:hypothetical protein